MPIEKAISLIQPWASALFVTRPDGEGPLKMIETRSWPIPKTVQLPLRVAIHASKSMPSFAKKFYAAQRDLGLLPEKLPMGCIIGFITIESCHMTGFLMSKISTLEMEYGDYTPGRWGWILSNPSLLPEPIRCSGSLGLWTIPREIRKYNGML